MSTFSSSGTFDELLASFINYEKLAAPPLEPRYEERASRGAMKMKRVMDVFQAVGNPQRAFKAVHITGSKGKGSTAAAIAAVLAQAGYTCGLYTSPAVFQQSERI